MRLISLIILPLLILSCGNQPTSTQTLTTEVIQVAYIPPLRTYIEPIFNCALDHPNTTIYLTETAAPFADLQLADITLWLGDPPENNLDLSAIQISEERIVFINYTSNPITKLSKENIEGIYSGRITNWGILEDGQGLINVWLYPKGDPIREILERNYLKTLPVTSLARIAPDPLAMFETISSDPSGIGYIPYSWFESNLVDEKIKDNITMLDLNDPEELIIPVLALTSGEPLGTVRSILSCLQISGGIKP